MIPIDNDIPIPAPAAKPPLYPLRDMKVGDSFRVGLDKAKAARSAVSAYTARTGAKFVTRKEDGGLRVWKTA